MSNENDWSARVNQRINDELAAIGEAAESDRIANAEDPGNDFAKRANLRISQELLQRQVEQRDQRDRQKLDDDADAMRRLEAVEAEREELLRRFNK